jgi:hypothetical protein
MFRGEEGRESKPPIPPQSRTFGFPLGFFNFRALGHETMEYKGTMGFINHCSRLSAPLLRRLSILDKVSNSAFRSSQVSVVINFSCTSARISFAALRPRVSAASATDADLR